MLRRFRFLGILVSFVICRCSTVTLRHTYLLVESLAHGKDLPDQIRLAVTYGFAQPACLAREIATELAPEYPDVTLEHMLVDTCAMQLILNPRRFDVMVTENTFGDILTDEAAALAGSMGMLPSASLAAVPSATGRRRRARGMYEPIHGSAPDIAGQGKANPLATILSVAMMLRYSLGLPREADAVEHAVDRALSDGLESDLADGLDFFDVYETAGLAPARARAGAGPTLLVPRDVAAGARPPRCRHALDRQPYAAGPADRLIGG